MEEKFVINFSPLITNGFYVYDPVVNCYLTKVSFYTTGIDTFEINIFKLDREEYSALLAGTITALTNITTINHYVYTRINTKEIGISLPLNQVIEENNQSILYFYITRADGTLENKVDCIIEYVNYISPTINSDFQYDVYSSLKKLEGYTDGLETLITATNTAIAALPAAPTYITIKGSKTADATLVTASGNGIFVVSATCYLSGAAEWWLTLYDGINHYKLMPSITTAAGVVEIINAKIDSGDQLYLNEISGSVSCFYRVTYYEL